MASIRGEIVDPQSATVPLPTATHAGLAMPDELRFLVNPPPEIGRVVSGYSTLKHGEKPFSVRARFVFVFGTILTVAVSSALLFLFWAWPREAWLMYVIMGALVFFGFLVLVYVFEFKRETTYVGEEGIASFACQFSPESIARKHCLRFQNSDALRIAVTDHYHEHEYSFSEYSYTWLDQSDKKVFTIKGKYRSENGEPASNDAYWFAVAAEQKWTHWLLANVLQKEIDTGNVSFNVEGGETLQVSLDGINLFSEQGEVTWHGDRSDLESVAIEDGTVKIKLKNAKEGILFSSGMLRIPFRKIGNARLFIRAAHDILQLPITSQSWRALTKKKK